RRGTARVPAASIAVSVSAADPFVGFLAAAAEQPVELRARVARWPGAAAFERVFLLDAVGVEDGRVRCGDEAPPHLGRNRLEHAPLAVGEIDLEPLLARIVAGGLQ